MEQFNVSTLQEFILLGFRVGQQGRLLLLISFIVIYIFTLVENLVIILVVSEDAQLSRLPMYILLSNFSWLEVCYVSATVPRMLFDLSFPGGVISFHACFIQFYVFFSLGTTECLFLSAMALDRYLAICCPLRYTQIMSKKFCFLLVAFCWITGFLCYIAPASLISRLSFCGPNFIDHYICDSGGLLALACHPPESLSLFCYVITSALILGTFLFIMISYVGIIFTLAKKSGENTGKKGFQTVSSHLAVVTIFYGSVATMYIGHTEKNRTENIKVMTLFYSAVAPLLNPLIYCLRNNQVKGALSRVLRKKGVI
ncbi:olfactory receptor 11H6-like [Protobothrops mucrosquamatus]|uniref:olfactory receptor 11H6-like n=1 Tax=Protobothrops mucrosquamatus TaxID=103944 RepID=UPI000775B3B6|nr:olfactory receptor 11H6-like [Protobothrops mucrosquamatus]